MNNDNKIRIMNEHGVVKEYGRIPDLWHIAMWLEENDHEKSGREILEVWHMAHDFKSAAEKQGKAKILSA